MTDNLAHRRLNREWQAKNAFNILLKLGHELTKFVDIVEDGKKIKILDVACGPGGNCALSFFKKFRDKKTVSVTATDNNPESIITLTRHVEALLQSEWFQINNIKAGLSIKLMDVMYMKEFEDSTFDYVVGVGALSNFDEPAKALKEIYRVLKDEGQLLLGDFFVPQIAQKDFKEVTKNNYGKPRPYIDYHNMLTMMDKFEEKNNNGFEIMSYMPVRWLHNNKKYKDKDQWKTMPDRIKYGYMEYAKRPDDEDSIVYSSFFLKAIKIRKDDSGKKHSSVYPDFNKERERRYTALPLEFMDGQIVVDTNTVVIITPNDLRKLNQMYTDFIDNAPMNSPEIHIDKLDDIKKEQFNIIEMIGILNPYSNLEENEKRMRKIAKLLKVDGKLIIADILRQSPEKQEDKLCLDYYDLMRVLHESNFAISYFRPDICEEDSSKDYFLLIAEKVEDENKKYDIYDLPEFNDKDFVSPYSVEQLCDKIKEVLHFVETNSDPMACLNTLLSDSTLSEYLLTLTKAGKIEDLPDRVIYWNNQVDPSRQTALDPIHARKMLNRFLLEYLYPDQTPKLSVCDKAVWEIWD